MNAAGPAVPPSVPPRRMPPWWVVLACLGGLLVLGGALGNIVDRARLGYVFDFADLHIGEFRPFLVFNVADACISIGVVILILRAFLVREPKPSMTKEPDNA